MNTKAEVLAKILADLPSAGDPPISAEDLRGVLDFMAAQEALAEETRYTNDFQPLLSNVEQFLDALLNTNIPLYVSSRGYASGFTVRWDNSLYTSNTAITAGGDDPDVSANWDETVSGAGGSTMTATEIRDALETLTGAAMLKATKVLYEGSTSVFTKIDGIETTLLNMQKELKHTRITVSSEGNAITVSGNLNIVNIAISHLVYYGKEGTVGSYDGLDFVYAHSGGDTIITLNPTYAISFENGSIVDILYYDDDAIV